MIKRFNLKEPLNVCGSSMGAYIAIKLLEEYQIRNLILFCPAVYDRRAFDVPFTEDFSEIIKKKDSWKNSDAFSILQHFKGKVLIFSGEKDEVIPKRLIEILNESLTKTQAKEIVTIPGCSHAIHQYLTQSPKWRKEVVEKICSTLGYN